MGQSYENPPTSILRCDRCGHVWMPEAASPAVAVAVAATDTGRCPRCDSARMRPLGRSASGVAYSRCDECDHLVINPPARA